MADEQTPNTDTTAQPAAPATQPSAGAPQITPEIQALIDKAASEAAQQAKNAAWAEARRTFEAKSKTANGGQPPQPPKPEPPPNGNGQDALALIALRDAFDDATSDLTLTGAQKKFVRELVMKERPSDVADYVSNFVTMSGWNSKPVPAGPAAAPAPAPTTTAAAAPTVPVTSRATAPAPSGPTDDTPILSMSDADRKALIAKIGDIKYAERVLKEVARDNVRVRPRLV